MGLRKPDKSLVGGIVLPELDNPAAAENIQSGYDAINQNGVRVAGALTLASMLPELTDAATAADVASGKQFVDSTGAVVSGTSNAVDLGNYTMFDTKGSGTSSITLSGAIGKKNLCVSFAIPTSYGNFTPEAGTYVGCVCNVLIVNGVCVAAVGMHGYSTSAVKINDITSLITWNSSTGALSCAKNGNYSYYFRTYSNYNSALGETYYLYYRTFAW